jgi:hypothetical protein
MARQFYALGGEVPIRITPFHRYSSPKSQPYAASGLEVPFRLPTDGLMFPLSFSIFRACFQDFGGQVRKQTGVIRPTFTARACRQVQQPARTLSHFRSIAALCHFGDR